ncbi:MAG: penicillin-binding protein activator [Lysobacteraceae bacterium]
MREQLAGAAGVLGAHGVGAAQGVERARREVGEVADRRGDHPQRAGSAGGAGRAGAGGRGSGHRASTEATGRILASPSRSRSPMRPGPSPRFLRPACAALLLGVALAGCATVATQHAPAAAHASPAAIREAQALARQDAALAGAARADNAAKIDRLLASLDDATLAREAAALPAGDPLYNFAGRALLNRGLALPRPFDHADHGFGAASRPPADRDGYRPPLKLAVLLPLTGELSRAAAPVRDGLLSGYYAETRRKPEIAFYDTADTPGGTLAAYRQAVAAGADLVLGPLGRDDVGVLFHADLPVPVLALNRGAVPPPAGNASFSLAPEDDGIEAAEFLLARDIHRVLVLSGDDDGMRRAVAAFRAHLQDRGGSVAAVLPVADKPGDLSAALQAAAQAPGGIDAVFLAVNAAQARALAPQLAGAGLGGKPRVGTSQLATGGGDAKHALDGIAFPSEPWTTRGVPGLPPPAAAAKTLPTARGAAARLFAFGYDAWRLAGHLDDLAAHADAKLPGATGTLRLDGFGNIVRTPAWSTWNGTTPLPLGDGAR